MYKDKKYNIPIRNWRKTINDSDEFFISELDSYNKIIQCLEEIYQVYYPYAHSNGKTITISGYIEEWQEKRKKFKLEEVLRRNKCTIEDFVKQYKCFADIANEILGKDVHGFIQLIKSISWNRKANLKGQIRLGVECLQLALMLKYVIEEHLKREILDIDEMSNISENDILTFIPDKMDQYGRLLRASRNQRYTDSKDKINYYNFRNKRLYYLLNSFDLDYQPRVILFVEGDTEEYIIPRFFEWYKGTHNENFAIQIINIKGITKFFGEKISIKDPQNNKYRKILASNFINFVSYNLNQWQMIPFVLGDNEGDIQHLLNTGMAINFEEKIYSFPNDWKYIWGVNNNNKPLLGKDFELTNFSNEELSTVLSNILPKKITEKDIEQLRSTGKGINAIDSKIDDNKLKIAEKLLAYIIQKYDRTEDQSILERPIFEVFNMILELAALNHLPVDKVIENENKKYILSILTK